MYQPGESVFDGTWTPPPVKLFTLSEFQGKPAKPVDDPGLPQVGRTDADVFENNFLEVMQFVFNHITFDPANEIDQAAMAAPQSRRLWHRRDYAPVCPRSGPVPKLERAKGREDRLIALALRIYWPEQASLKSTWTPRPVVPVN